MDDDMDGCAKAIGYLVIGAVILGLMASVC